MIVCVNNIISNKMENENMNGMDLSTACRTCLKENENMQCIFEYKNDSQDTFLHKLMACAPVKISKGDGLSSNICQNCLRLVETFFNFQQTCVQADKVLHRHNKGSKEKPIVYHYRLGQEEIINENDYTNPNEYENQNKESFEECTDYEYLELVADDTELSAGEQINVKIESINFDVEDELDSTADDETQMIIEEDYEEASVDYTEEEDPETYTNSNSQDNFINLPGQYTICYQTDAGNVITPDNYEEHDEKQYIEFITEENEEVTYNNTNEEDNTYYRTEQMEVLNDKEPVVISVKTGDHIMGHDVYDMYVSGCEISKGQFLLVTKESQPPGTKKRDYDYYHRIPPNDIDNEIDENGKRGDDGPFECWECGERFLSEINLNKHRDKHIINGCSGNLCLSCNTPYTHECLVAKHKRVNNRSNFKCTVKNCTSKFSSTLSRTNHILLEHPEEKPNMGADNGEENYMKNKYPCSFCSKKFLCKSGLAMHHRTHTGEKPYMCAVCGKTFATLGGLDLHHRRHTGERPFVCNYCNRGFAETSNLKVHIRSHTGEKPYPCDVCGRKFARVFLLQLHKRTHTGEKPYPCTYCGKAFRQQGDLASHIRIHNGDRPHKCPFCDKGFIKSSGLNTHLKTHNRQREIS